MRNGIVGDASHGLLAITPLLKATLTSAATATGSEITVASMPKAVTMVLLPISMTAAHTLDVLVEGYNNATEGWVTVATFAQVLSASLTVKRVDVLAPKKKYRVTHTGGGAFGGGTVVFAVLLVGTNVGVAPIVQQD